MTDQFKAARLAKGWTQKQLAYFSGLSVEMIRRLEHGQTNPRLYSLVRLAKALDCELVLRLEMK
jgi:transcriptional regulator with XRE-family HTH domain